MKTLGAIAAVILLLTLVTIGGHDAALGSTFTPTEYSVTLGSSTASANSSFTVSYTLDSPNALEEAHVSFIPSAWGVANDAAVPNGAIVGTLSLNIAESVSNGACNDSKFLSFDLLEATTDTTPANLLADSPRIPSATWPGFLDTSPANSLPDAVDKYPAFLASAYSGLTARSRAYGSVPSAVAGINRVANVLVFEPGTSLPGMSPISASLGFIVVIVIQDPTAPATSSTITDQCSTYVYTRQDRGLTQNNINTPANEANFVYRTNPATDGTYTFMEYLRSQRDIDNDGVENRLDACPYVSTPSWNPRNADPIYDVDGDGIPGQDNLGIGGEQLLAGSGCDPTPLTANTDPDGDAFTNRQDNCALIANALQEDPDRDGIGNACDTVDTAPDGHLHEICATVNVDVGTPGTPTTPTCPEFIVDMDSDGFSKTTELYLATDPTVSCGSTSSAPSAGWPADLFGGGVPASANKVTVADITSFLAPIRYLDTNVGTHTSPYQDKRWDIVPGKGLFTKDINIQDLTLLLVHTPPMFEGVRAMNGPLCPWP